MRRDTMAATRLSPDEARLRRLVVEVGHDPAPLGQEDIASVLRHLNGDIQKAAGALIVLHGLQRCEARSGDSVRCVACGVPIVAEQWAVVERATAAFHPACLTRLRGLLPLPLARIRRP